jgi:dienelactone hydrolase
MPTFLAVRRRRDSYSEVDTPRETGPAKACQNGADQARRASRDAQTSFTLLPRVARSWSCRGRRSGPTAAEVRGGVDQLRAAPGVDPSRIALWFFSGSGLLAAQWLEQAPSWPRCLAATYPRFCPPPELPQLPTAIDAIARSPHLPVVLTRVGLERPELAAAVEQFAAAAANISANLEIIDVPNGHHSFDIIDHTDESRAAVRQALDHVAGHLHDPTGPA